MTSCTTFREKKWRRDADQFPSVHVVAGLDDAHGGPSYSVPRLCEALVASGNDTTLLSVGGAALSWNKGYRAECFACDYAHVPILRNLRSSSGLSMALSTIAPAVSVIHNHGLWLMPNVVAGWAAARAQKPLVVSPRGMLSPVALAFSHLKKRTFWRLLQGPAIRQTACIHVTSEQEYEEIRGFGMINPVSVIPNGIDLPELPAKPDRKASPHRIVLSLGRIHPKKGLDRLVRAWARIEVNRPDWRLRIIGPGEARHRDELRALMTNLGLGRASIEQPAYGEAKQAAYRGADLFVLPTMNENFGLSVGEALAAGTPAISTKGAPWSGLESEGCGWWIDHGVDPLTTALAYATAMPSDALRAMGTKGRAWIERDFSWDRVALEMTHVYRWLAGKGEAPSTLRDD